jgi:hypothetical protein
MTRPALITLLASLFLPLAPVAADVCRWTDDRGVIHFSQRCDPNQTAVRRWHGGTTPLGARAAPASAGAGTFTLSVTTTPALQERTAAGDPVPPKAPRSAR